MPCGSGGDELSIARGMGWWFVWREARYDSAVTEHQRNGSTAAVTRIPAIYINQAEDGIIRSSDIDARDYEDIHRTHSMLRIMKLVPSEVT